jgi:hypothetical protein
MYWTELPVAEACLRHTRQIFLCLSLILAWPASLQAEAPTSSTEVWLVTYGPGEIYWQRFGHNAIWIRDQGLGLNHVFNFGFFDFEQEAFFRRFLQGKLLYFSAAQPAEREFSQYIDENRSIRAQRLNLSADQSLRLAEYLVTEVQPENRDYLYDYYTNNCSTRIRDALDLALDGKLAEEYQAASAKLSWRDHTRRLTVSDFWLYLGLETGLGPGVDREINRWEEFFIPSELASAVEKISVSLNGVNQPLVLDDVMLYESSQESPPAAVGQWWPRYLLVSVSILFGCWLACLLLPALTPLRLVRAWLILAGLVGAALVFFWFFTDHRVARFNLNVLVFNPLWCFLAVWKRKRTAGATLLTLSTLALLSPILLPVQYNLDVLAAVLPLNIASGLVLFRHPSRQAGQPGAPEAVDQ